MFDGYYCCLRWWALLTFGCCCMLYIHSANTAYLWLLLPAVYPLGEGDVDPVDEWKLPELKGKKWWLEKECVIYSTYIWQVILTIGSFDFIRMWVDFKFKVRSKQQGCQKDCQRKLFNLQNIVIAHETSFELRACDCQRKLFKKQNIVIANETIFE